MTCLTMMVRTTSPKEATIASAMDGGPHSVCPDIGRRQAEASVARVAAYLLPAKQ
jgi:hypothetical protein